MKKACYIILAVVALSLCGGVAFTLGEKMLFKHVILRSLVEPVVPLEAERVNPELEGRLVYVKGVPAVECEDFGVRVSAVGLHRVVWRPACRDRAPEACLQSRHIFPRITLGAHTLIFPEDSIMLYGEEEQLVTFSDLSSLPESLRGKVRINPGTPTELLVTSADGREYHVELDRAQALNAGAWIPGPCRLEAGKEIELICRQHGDTLTLAPDMRVRLELAKLYREPVSAWVWVQIVCLLALFVAPVTLVWVLTFGYVMRRKGYAQIKRPVLIVGGLISAALVLALLVIYSYLGANGFRMHGFAMTRDVQNLLPESYFDTCRQIREVFGYASAAIWLFVIIPSIVYSCIKRRKQA